jgi:cytochrome bd-type quinol oxidase subunit 1
MVFVRLQVQKNTRLVSGAMYCIGSNGVPSWLPSQNGWFCERPQAHHQYSSPAVTWMGSGALPPMAG